MASVKTTDGKKVLVGSKAYDKALAEGRIPGKSSSKPKTSSPSKSSSREIDTSYFLRPGESIAEYNVRTGRAADPSPAPTISGSSTQQLEEIQRRALEIQEAINDPTRVLVKEQLSDATKRSQFDALPDDLKGIYLQVSRSLEKAIEAGKVVNPNIEITPAENRKLLEQARTELEPYYAERLDFLRDDFETSIGRLTGDVDKIAERRREPFAQTLRNQAEGEAQAGTVYSSGRQRRERNLVIGENQVLEDLTTDARRAAEDSAKAFERQAGSSALRTLSIPNIGTYRATNRGIVDTGTRRLYEPTTGDALGSIEKEKTTAIEARRSALEDVLRRGRILDLAGLS